MIQSHYTLYIGVSVNKDKTQGAVGVAVYDEEYQLADSFAVLVDRNIDSTELELTAIVECLRYAFNDDVIYSTSDFCVRGYNEWLDDWKRKGWRKSDKKPVAYRQLWQLVDEERSEKFVDVRKLRSSPELDLAYRLAKEELEEAR
ncbi:MULTISPECIES: RNase H family protein [Vibrio]|uniref:RNase H family protein n=1 Tax=Vibrio TaxID=662 RepID=UPI00192C10D6|nr:RNase H family protein [Vibrio fluvialis]EGR1107462.1 ribonuclease H [Vibrio cholerae]EKF9130468.1 ribonuclease H [Vibrio cholerae]EKF9788004.1 ribonuclease H [Vibrio cholerae]MBL4305126.1 ribonuclease H [Vibrio fluvialis]GIC32728.1 ribonuclease H [Vibrio cholerae]